MIRLPRAILRKLSGLAVPSISDLFFIVVFLLIAFPLAPSFLRDGDTLLHIKIGQYILEHRTIPQYDIYSFLSPSLPWTAHEWLSEVLMAFCYQAGGFAGVVALFALTLALAFVVLFRQLMDESGDILLAGAVTVFALLSSAIHWLARPHLFSLLLTVICYQVLDRFQRRGEDRLWVLPPLMLLWVNLHGGYIFGLILILIYLCGNTLYWFGGRGEAKSRAGTRARKLAAFLLICTAAAMINPWGYKILTFPFALTSDRFLMAYASEFMSPDFHQPMPFKYYLLLLIVLLGIAKVRADAIELALIVLLTYMALYSARYIPLFAVIAAPITVRLAQGALSAIDNFFTRFLRRRSANFGAVEASLKGRLWPCIVVLAVGAQVASGTFKVGLNPTQYPVAAVEFLQRERIDGKMFNSDEFGDYLLFAAWPQYRVFVDSRSDMYGAKWIGEYIKVANVEPDWLQTLAKHEMNWVIFRSGSTLVTALSEHRDWRLIFADQVASIFVKNDDRYRKLIEKYRDVKPWAPRKVTPVGEF